MRAPLILTFGLIVLAGCTPTKPPEPSQGMKKTFAQCTWGKVAGRTLSIWSYACPEAAGGIRLVANDAVGGFRLVTEGQTQGYDVIRTFAKTKDAPPESVLPAVLAATGAHEASCALVKTPAYGDWGEVWLLEPTGAEKAAYDKANAIEPQANPCGDLGIGPAGDRFFKVMPDDPKKVIYYDMGSEIQIFDPATLKSR